jgi:hypothetical protein
VNNRDFVSGTNEEVEMQRFTLRSKEVKNLCSTLSIVIGFMSPNFADGRIESFSERHSAMTHRQNLSADIDVDVLNMKFLVGVTDPDPYQVFLNAVSSGHIYDDSDLTELQERFSDQDFRARIPEFTAIASPHTVKLGRPLTSINRFADDFDLVIVINTAATGTPKLRQMGYVLERDFIGDPDKRAFQLRDIFFVSSGTHEMQTVPLYGPDLRPLIKKSNGLPLTKTYFRGTEAGFFPVNFLDRSHASATLRRHAPLQFFIGYNPKDGQGIHQEKVIKHQRLSNGCVRVPSKTARELFVRVDSTYTGSTDKGHPTQLRYMDKLTGAITVIDIPEELRLIKSKEVWRQEIANLEKSAFGQRRGDFNQITGYRTLVIINDEPDRDFSDLAEPETPETPEAPETEDALPNAG